MPDEEARGDPEWMEEGQDSSANITEITEKSVTCTVTYVTSVPKEQEPAILTNRLMNAIVHR